MAKETKNQGWSRGDEKSTALDVYDRKYLRYFTDDYKDKVSINVFNALKTKDIGIIENCVHELSDNATNFILHIGLICMIVEKERLYEGTEFGISYLSYAEHLFDNLSVSRSSLSEAKTIVEKYIQYNKQLARAGFRLSKNTQKLLFLDEALENHDELEVFARIANDTYRGFRDWAQRKNIARPRKPEKEIRVDAEIKGNRLIINGKDILNFPKGTAKEIKELIKDDLQKTFSIREGGNLPFIVGTYSRGEQTAIDNFLKKTRAKR